MIGGRLGGIALVTVGQNGEFTGTKVSWQYLFFLLVKICCRLGTAFENEGETLRGSRKCIYMARQKVEKF